MRLSMALPFVVAPLLLASDGVPPRPAATDYPVHNNMDALDIGAALAPAKEVKKILPADAVNKFLVVEVGMYPGGSRINVDSFDFSLKYGDEMLHPSTPEEVVAVWKEKSNTTFPGHGVDVSNEEGITCAAGTGTAGPNGPVGSTTPGSPNPTNPNANGTGPVMGPTRGCATYTGVRVDVGQPAPGHPVNTGQDAHDVEARARARALPEGNSVNPVAGYLYFALPKKHTSAPGVLRYSKGGASIELTLPAK